MKFVDRQRELKLLDELYQREGAQLLVLYGRRRVGKTRLITHWISQLQGEPPHGTHAPKALYWMASQTSATNQLRAFSQALFAYHHPEAHIDPTFSYASWGAAFEEVGRISRPERVVVVLDEFTYVMQSDTEVPSLLQAAWDHLLKDRSQVFLILTGSLAGMIQRSILDYQAPLYGRATGRIQLQPMKFGALAEWMPTYQTDERVVVYALAGGIPAYLELFDDKLSITENIKQRIVTPANLMMADAVFLLHEQLDQPRNYMAILEAIAAGYHGLSEIANMAGIERSNILKYLGVLQTLGYVERQVPATVRRPERSRKGRYQIVDAYLRFYFRFLAPNLTFIEGGMVQQALGLIQDHLTDFIGTYTFEELCRDWVGVRADQGNLPFLPERIGSFWSSEAQVDVVAVNWRTKDILLGECKWGNRKVGRQVIRELYEKEELVVPRGKWRVHYVFFARKGFTEAAQGEAQRIGAHLVKLEVIEADIQAWMHATGKEPAEVLAD